jgi:chromosome segregation ATPase
MTNELRVLEDRIAELQEQNTHLREAAATFAQLAERLNERLRKEAARNRRTSGRSRTRASVDAIPTSV